MCWHGASSFLYIVLSILSVLQRPSVYIPSVYIPFGQSLQTYLKPLPHLVAAPGNTTPFPTPDTACYPLYLEYSSLTLHRGQLHYHPSV